jgi:hypothetical protein
MYAVRVSVPEKLPVETVSVSTSTTPSKSAEKLVTTAKPASYSSFGKTWGPISTITPGATDAFTSSLSSMLDKFTADVVSATPVVTEKLFTATKLAFTLRKNRVQQYDCTRMTL